MAFSWTSLAIPAVSIFFLISSISLFLPRPSSFCIALSFSFCFQNVRDAVQAFERINRLEQILFFIHGKLQVGVNRVREARRIIYSRRGDHRVVIEALRKFDE